MSDPINNFGPLTPEQQAMLERDRIHETIGPLDFLGAPGMPGRMAINAVERSAAKNPNLDLGWLLSTLGNAGAQSAAQAGIQGVAGIGADGLSQRWYDNLGWSLPGALAGSMVTRGRNGPLRGSAAGAVAGTGAALVPAFQDAIAEDERRNTTIRDAEGQPGGFYGNNALMKYRNGQY